MEDYEAQEVEFWAKLEEEGMSRSSMLRRSAAAAVGLTVLGNASTAFGMSRARLAAPPTKETAAGLAQLVKNAKKEGHLNAIALPTDWVNYGELMSTFQKNYKTIPRALKDTRGFWMGDYWGAISIGYNQGLVSNPPKTWKDLLKPEYKGKVALNGSPLSSNSAVSGVIAASLCNGGSLADVGPGIDFFAQMKKSGNFIPVGTTPQTVASGQTPISIDWDYNNLAYIKEFPAARWAVSIPSDGVYGGYYAQAINANAPHPWAARLWEEFIYSDQGQILFLKGFGHPARFPDLASRKVLPKSLLAALPAPSIYVKAKFASISQQTAAKAKIASDWPSKVG
jgi:putative spermidine/putrescine transport system substrate-binding protein